MSAYGKLWQKVSDIRAALKASRPAIDTSTLANAIRSINTLDDDARTLLGEWADLEREMAKCE